MRFLFGCSHKRTSFPITLPERARKVAAPQSAAGHRTYITCLDCGKEIPYSWEEMRVVSNSYSAPRPELHQSSTAA